MTRANKDKPKVGDLLRCTHAATSAYRVDEIYEVVKCPNNGVAAIKARDGFLDLLSMVVSKFEPAHLKTGPRHLEVVPK